VFLPHEAKYAPVSSFSEYKQESECKYQMSSGARAGVTFCGTGTGAAVKKETPITSVSQSMHLILIWYNIVIV